MLPLGFRLWRAGRLPWRASRVKGISGLRRIIAKAEEMEQIHPREGRTALGYVGYGTVAERTTAGTGGGVRA
jgi:hypothetical protein